MNIQHSGGGSRSFAKERRALEVKSAVASQWTLITTSWEPSLKMILFQLHGKLLKNSTSTILQVIQHLKQMRKMKKLDKWVPHELTANQKNRPSQVLSSPILHNNNAPFLYWIVMCNKKWILFDKHWWWPAQWLDGEEDPKHFSMPNLHQKKKKGYDHCLVVCCPSDPWQLSESWWNHYIWEVCSANRWDALKIAMPTAGIGPQKGPNSLQKCLTTCHVTKASKVE